MPGSESAGGGLAEYRRKRDPRRTPEPVPADDLLPRGGDDTFVIQEHHASALHWDLRLERDGVLVSWALPKGVPPDPRHNHLAVHTEDHPLDYAGFEGEIPAGEYGGGKVQIWDRGHYLTEKWDDNEVKVVLEGGRVTGRYVLFQTGGKNWMIHRMDPPPAGWQPLPDLVRPMLATPDGLPRDETNWAFELKWDGVRAISYVDGGRVTLRSRGDHDVTSTYPELRRLGEQLGATQVVLDGEVVAFDDRGRPSFGRLQKRMGVSAPTSRLLSTHPVLYVVFDLLHLDGRSTLDLPYRQRRSLLDGLQLEGPTWRTVPQLEGSGEDLLFATREQGLEGVLAKRLDSPYRPGQRSKSWRKIKNELTQDVVVGGWKPGQGRRSETVGSLLLGLPTSDGLEYVGKVGTGFTSAMLDDLHGALRRIERKTSPFADVPRADAKDARWCTPRLVGEVVFSEWTSDGRLRHPSWRGLRPERPPDSVGRES